MKAKEAIQKIHEKLRGFGFSRCGESLHYATDGNEVDVYVSEGRIHVDQVCHPMKEGWSMSTFKISPRGVALAASRAKAER
jgi:hypothetical protein